MNCLYCKTPLRKRRLKYKDFEGRKYHVKCFKKFGLGYNFFLLHYNIEMGSLGKTIKKEEKPNHDHYLLKFGKYKGKTFKYLVDNDHDYCNWILQLEDFKNDALINYINEHIN